MTTLSLPCRHCDETISGENEDELLARVQSHVQVHGIDHPITREHLLARLHHHDHRESGAPASRYEDRYTSTPPWDIGRFQPAFAALAESGAIQGRVLDAGCGTGEHALMAAALGLDATGVDLATNALRTAENKARDRGLTARFLCHDARKLAELGETFDTVLDCGLFHIFSGDDRAAYVASLHSVLKPGGRYFVLGFSDRHPGTWGPHRLTRDEITATFAHGWRIDAIEPAMIEVNIDSIRARRIDAAMTEAVIEAGGVHAWRVALTRF